MVEAFGRSSSDRAPFLYHIFTLRIKDNLLLILSVSANIVVFISLICGIKFF